MNFQIKNFETKLFHKISLRAKLSNNEKNHKNSTSLSSEQLNKIKAHLLKWRKFSKSYKINILQKTLFSYFIEFNFERKFYILR
jgi:hypothetical protein